MMPSIRPTRPPTIGVTVPGGTTWPPSATAWTAGGGMWPGEGTGYTAGGYPGGGTNGYTAEGSIGYPGGGTTGYPGDVSIGYPGGGSWGPWGPTGPWLTTSEPWLQGWDSMTFEPNFYRESYKDSSSIWPFEGARCPNRSSVAVLNPVCNLTCNEDYECPTLELCCPNGCGKVCVPPVFPNANTTDEGCSVSFVVDFYHPYRFNHNISLIFNLVWESLHQGFSSELKASFYFHGLKKSNSYFTPETVTNACDLEDALNDIQGYRGVSSHHPLAKSNKVLIAIVSEMGNNYSPVWHQYQHYAAVFSSFCVIVVGNPDIADNITQSVPCVWRVATFEGLRNISAKVIETLSSNGCFIQADESCPTIGSACDDDSGCSRKTVSCINGTCQSPTCPIPNTIPNYENDYDYCSSYGYPNDYEYPYDYDYSYSYGSGRVKRSDIHDEISHHEREYKKQRRNIAFDEKVVNGDFQGRVKGEDNTVRGHKKSLLHHKLRSGFDIRRNAEPTLHNPEVGPLHTSQRDQATDDLHMEKCNDSKPAYIPCGGLEGEAKKKCLRVKDPGDPRCKQTIDTKPIQDTSAMLKALRNGKLTQPYVPQQPELGGEPFMQPLPSQPTQGSNREQAHMPISGTMDKISENLRSSHSYYSTYYLYKPLEKSGCCAEGLLKCTGVPAMCLYGDLLCDGVKHCINGDDEDSTLCTNRTCAIDEFRCDSGQCIEASGECDGLQQCTDGSDEHCQRVSDCPSSRSHYCSSGECIYPSFLCDNITDCKNGEDEKPCDCTGFKCNSGECIPHNIICDDYQECSDGSDEAESTCKNFVCPENAFKCGSGVCIKQHLVCDEYPDCADGSDENESVCKNKECLPGQWKCENGRCIPRNWLCNGWNECDDFSDEGVEKCGECKQFLCDSGECIPSNYKCDNYRHCQDNSDEKNCTSPSCFEWEFQCGSGECISEDKVQDGREHCADGSDEYIGVCLNSYKTYQCTSGECIGEYQVCDGKYDCKDRKDEAICEQVGCPSHRPYQCESGECIWSPNSRCDGYRDCADGSDEKNCTGVPCPGFGTIRCKNGFGCFSSYSVCDGYKHCSDGSDEENCPEVSCGTGYFRCDSTVCLATYWRCDGSIQCIDRSDERNCNGSICAINEFLCKSGECIGACQQCDGDVDCLDGSDESDCGSFTCPSDRSYHCDSGECISNYTLCDGRRDCLDGSDETKCLQMKCPAHRPFQCSTGQCISERNVCNGNRVCQDASDETFCNSTNCPAGRPFYCSSGECISEWSVCDGWNQCRDGSDENCTSDMCPDSRPFFCPSSQKCISNISVCNGYSDCDDGSDEDTEMCKSFICPNTTFKCNSGRCIAMNWVCNNGYDCPDGDDEDDCKDFIRPCTYSEFRCNNNHCIPGHWICDSYNDCPSGEDEVGCTTITGQITPTTALPIGTT